MRLFSVDREDDAAQVRQLLALNSECVTLHWSKKITNVPLSVLNALGTVENFVEEKVGSYCTAGSEIIELNDDEETSLFKMIRTHMGLKRTIGTGVILRGKEVDEVKSIIAGAPELVKINNFLNSNKNYVLF